MAPNLLSIALEIQLEIPDQLPAREVQKLRSVCKDLKEIADTNKDKIANVQIERERQRIVDHLNYCVFYTDNPNLMEKLSRFYDIRGIWCCENCHEVLGKLIFYHAVPHVPSKSAPFSDRIELVKAMAAEHHACRLQYGARTDRDKTTHYLAATLCQHQLDYAAIERICDEVICEAAGLFSGEPHAETEHYATTQPEFLLSGLIGASHTTDHGSDKRKLMAGVCTPLEISEWFGLPALPNRIFAYCLKNKVLYERF